MAGSQTLLSYTFTVFQYEGRAEVGMLQGSGKCKSIDIIESGSMSCAACPTSILVTGGVYGCTSLEEPAIANGPDHCWDSPGNESPTLDSIKHWLADRIVLDPRRKRFYEGHALHTRNALCTHETPSARHSWHHPSKCGAVTTSLRSMCRRISRAADAAS